MKRAFFATLALALAVTVGAVTTGGFPSFLRLQALGVNTSVPAAGVVNAATDVQVGGTSINPTSVANVVKYTDSGTNFTGATPPTISGSAICRANGTNCPTVTPAPITCTTACSGAAVVVGQSVILIKGSQTSRASTTTFTVDPDLQISSLPAGQYITTVFLNFVSGGSAGGIKAEMANGTGCPGYNGGGLWQSNVFAAPAFTNVSTGAPNFTGSGSNDPVLTTHITYGNSSSGVMVCWAQSASNATALVLQGGTQFGSSSITVTRIQ